MMKTEVLERVRITTPLGLRFRDMVTNKQVCSGLSVNARSEDNPRQIVTAQQTSSGGYAFHHLPGLREFEYSNEDLHADQFEMDPLQYIIRVDDLQGRYMPVAFRVSAPRMGLVPNGEGNASPPGLSAYDLFPLPVRSAPGGYAEVRADLKDNASGLSAAHAVLEVQVNGKSYFGLSGRDGKVIVMFPYPPVEVAKEGSPVLFDTLTALSEQEWSIHIRVRYEPGSLKSFDGIKEPDLRTILKQGHGFLYDGSPGEVTELSATLTYAQPLVLRTNGKSELMIGV